MSDASLWAGPYLEARLFRVGPRDPWSVAARVAVPLLAGLAACVVPARRTIRVDPAVTLRTDWNIWVATRLSMLE